MVRYLLSLLLLMAATNVFAYQEVKGKVFNEKTGEPLEGVTITAITSGRSVVSFSDGSFRIDFTDGVLLFTAVGYKDKQVVPASGELLVGLEPTQEELEKVIFTAGRGIGRRAEAPVAIATVSEPLIRDTRAATLNELVSKVPGVFMMRYVGEGHNMSIRQPLSTNAYFLYLEDGIPVRPMGLFNHNTLIETNIRSVKSIEVVRGPVSSLYGPEAVGGAINLITRRPSVLPSFEVGYRGDQYNFNQLEAQGSGKLSEKLGVYAGGFIARQKNGWRERSDYDKLSLNLKMEYKLSDRNLITLASTYNDYYVQEGLSFDSIAFYSKTYEASNDFMYRDVSAWRTRLTWSGKTLGGDNFFITAFHRYNDYRQSPNHTVRWAQGATTATSERQFSVFNSYGLVAQYTKRWGWRNSGLILGASHEQTPTGYFAHQIDLNAELRPDGLSVKKYRFAADRKEVSLGDYSADIYNTALYAQYEMSPMERLKLVAGARFDRFNFEYENFLDASAGEKSYSSFTPKVGLTYEAEKGKGLYANYSVGFAPPGLTAIFRKRPVVNPGDEPFYYNLQPATFYNAELGGWWALAENKLLADISVYHLIGRDELLSIRMPDNSTDYRSAGKTTHKGIEWGLSYKPSLQWWIRTGGAYALHRYDDFVLSERPSDPVKQLGGKEMPAAPKVIMNTEVFYYPSWLEGFRISAEWQWLSPWYLNQVNTVKYDDEGFLGFRGVSVLNIRMGYEWKGLELFLNVLNATDELYAYNASRGNGATDRTNYSPAAPATIGFGIYYAFGKKSTE